MPQQKRNQPRKKAQLLQKPSKGIIIVASRRYCYYEAAHRLIDSIYDVWPEANIALFAHDEWTVDDERCDDLYLVKDCPAHKRAKLWALPQTPFETTLYIDADCYVVHEDIHDLFEFDGHMGFTNIRSYAGAIAKFIGGEMTLHGGVFAYDDSDTTMEFLKDWWEYHEKQCAREWWPEEQKSQQEQLIHWDQFTLWWLLENKWKDKLKVFIYKDDARYNYIHVYRDGECEGEMVISHYTIPGREIEHERNID